MLKKLFVFVFILGIILINKQLKAQIIKGEAIAGFNLSKVEGDRVNNGMIRFNKIGVNLGLGVLIPVWNNFDINMEVLFNQKGAYRRNGPNPDSAQPNYQTSLNYAEVPLLIQYTDRDRITVGTGLSYSRLVGAKWLVNGRLLTDNPDDGYFSRDNLDWLLDFRFRIYEQLKMNIRYSYSLTSIWSGPDDALLETLAGEKQSTDQRSSMISFRLIWVFNEKQSKRNLNRSNNE
jgi:hypothetical protein